jgi:hypothetical protein
MSIPAAYPNTFTIDISRKAQITGRVLSGIAVLFLLFSHTLFPVYVAALLWGGLWLRDRRVRALLPVA